MRILFTAAPGYGLMLPIVPLIWAARAAGHEVVLATTSEMAEVGARAGLPVVDVFPQRDLWAELMKQAQRFGSRGDDSAGADDAADEDIDPLLRRAQQAGNPFGLFTLTMTEPSIAVGREFGAELVVHTSDHAAGALTAQGLGVPALDVGNRVSWSLRDRAFRAEHDSFLDNDITRELAERLGLPAERPRTVARIDPRPPSMGGLTTDEPDAVDPDVPWWSMRYVPFNGGAVLPDWASRRPERPRIGVTLGTVVPAVNGLDNLAVTVRALGTMDVEVVLAGGSADLSALGALPDNVRSVGYLPLSAFLPSCSVLVHHGGSGTTAAPLFYGVPQLVMPGFADNPMSAQRVADRGVGISQDPSTVDDALVRTLVERLLTEPSFATAAAEVAAEMATQPSPAAVLDRAVAAARG